MNLIDYFPEDEVGGAPRKQQTEALTFIENAFKDDVHVVVIEAPPGVGKTGIGMAVSRAYGGGIIACPTIQLQSVYVSEFENTAPLIGRSRFPCLETAPDALESIPIILQGEIPRRPILDESCAKAPCLNKPYKKSQRIKEYCETHGGCPHQHSLDVAQESETIISNLHSLMYSVSLNERISRREVLVIDECHDLQAFMRDFLKVKFKIRRKVFASEVQHLKTTGQWLQWLELPEQMALLRTQDAKDSYMERIERLEKIGDSVFQFWDDEKDGRMWLELTPIHVGNACKSMLFSLAKKVVLMSGTIYSKEMFLKPLGVDPSTAAFTRISSDFPVGNRPVVLPRRQNLDLSHKGWEQNIHQALKDIKNIMNHHKHEKGLIHVSSYSMMREISEALNDPRIITHEPTTFAPKLKDFYAADDGQIFISPTISQGVDFKEDLARWQILVRPKYGAISDPYVKHLIDSGLWGVYSYLAAIVFGQQLGRVVRSNKDTGVTYLLSSTFNNLVAKSSYLLPLWQKQGFIK